MRKAYVCMYGFSLRIITHMNTRSTEMCSSVAAWDNQSSWSPLLNPRVYTFQTNTVTPPLVTHTCNTNYIFFLSLNTLYRLRLSPFFSSCIDVSIYCPYCLSHGNLSFIYMPQTASHSPVTGPSWSIDDDRESLIPWFIVAYPLVCYALLAEAWRPFHVDRCSPQYTRVLLLNNTCQFIETICFNVDLWVD